MNAATVIGSDERLAMIIKDRERIRGEMRSLSEAMMERTHRAYLEASAALREQAVKLDKRMLDEAMHYGQQEIPGI